MKDDAFKFAVLAEKTGYDKPLFMHNLSLSQLYDEVVIPFEEGKPFFLDGVSVKKDLLQKIKITKQDDRFIERFEDLHENVRFRIRDAGVFIPIEDYPGRLAALFRESGPDVTSRVVNAYQEKKGLKVPAEIISAASQIVVAAIKAVSS